MFRETRIEASGDTFTQSRVLRIVTENGLENTRVQCLSTTVLFDVKNLDVAKSSYKMFRSRLRIRRKDDSKRLLTEVAHQQSFISALDCGIHCGWIHSKSRNHFERTVNRQLDTVPGATSATVTTGLQSSAKGRSRAPSIVAPCQFWVGDL